MFNISQVKYALTAMLKIIDLAQGHFHEFIQSAHVQTTSIINLYRDSALLIHQQTEAKKHVSKTRHVRDPSPTTPVYQNLQHNNRMDMLDDESSCKF